LEEEINKNFKKIKNSGISEMKYKDTAGQARALLGFGDAGVGLRCVWWCRGHAAGCNNVGVMEK
jgi:hypothetical protein